MNKFIISFEEAPKSSPCKYKTGKEIIEYVKGQHENNYVSRQHNGTGFLIVKTEESYDSIVKSFGFNGQTPLFIGFVCKLPDDVAGYYDKSFWSFIKGEK